DSGHLPGAQLRNIKLKFIAKPVPLTVVINNTDFKPLYEKDLLISMPIAHGEGNYFAESDVIKQLEDQGRVVFRYAENPNGSLNDIAGIVNEQGNVLGLMPHPERAAEALHGCRDGATMFVSLFKRIKG
ncbi:MAG: phosphoribosylformylglycinamidine synthase subunit PurQ, partial [Bdellovibrionales bacterium]